MRTRYVEGEGVAFEQGLHPCGLFLQSLPRSMVTSMGDSGAVLPVDRVTLDELGLRGWACQSGWGGEYRRRRCRQWCGP